MSVSMLLNAADVVTAAERCQAIDKKTGRIPINFLLSRSTDLDDHVKDQLQQLAVQSPSISILPDPAAQQQQQQHPPNPPAAHPQDAEMTDVAPADNYHHPSPPHHSPPPMDIVEPHDSTHDSAHDSAYDSDDESEDPCIESYHNTESLQSLPHHPTNDAEEEALKDIDRETLRPDRKMIRRALKRNEQTLTRKAIRKHTAGKKGPKDLSLLPRDTSSTINTVSGSSCIKSSSQGSNSNTPRRRWKEWEDELLIQVVAEHGPTRWNALARHFPGRNGRQVRLRWMNHLQPSLDKRPWRPEEDAVLLEAHNALGNKWALIAMRLCGRTDNSVKNRYKSIVRRSAREAKARRQAHQE